MERISFLKESLSNLDRNDPEILTLLKEIKTKRESSNIKEREVSKNYFFDYYEKANVTKTIINLEKNRLDVQLVDTTYNLISDTYDTVEDKYTSALNMIDNSALMALAIIPTDVIAIYTKKIRIKTLRIPLKDGWNIYIFKAPSDFKEVRSGWFNLKKGITNERKPNEYDFLLFGQTELIIFNQFTEIIQNKIRHLPEEYLNVILSHAEKTLISFDPISEQKIIHKFMPFCNLLKPISHLMKMRYVKIIKHSRAQKSDKKYISTSPMELTPYRLEKANITLDSFDLLVQYFKAKLNINLKTIAVIMFRDKINFTLPSNTYIIAIESDIYLDEFNLKKDDLIFYKESKKVNITNDISRSINKQSYCLLLQ